MNMINVLNGWYNKHKNNIIGVMIFIILIMLLYQCNSYKKISKENDILKNNLEVTTSKESRYKDKLNNLYTERQSYIGSIKDVEKVNKELAKELEEYKKLSKKDPIFYTSFNTKIKHDTIFLLSSVNKIDSSNVVHINFNFDTLYNVDTKFNLEGKLIYDFKTHDVKTFSINSIKLRYKSKISLSEEKDNKYIVNVNSSIPFAETDSLNSIVLDKIIKKDKKYSIGVQIGVRLDNNFKAKPYIGIGITRKIISF